MDHRRPLVRNKKSMVNLRTTSSNDPDPIPLPKSLKKSRSNKQLYQSSQADVPAWDPSLMPAVKIARAPFLPLIESIGTTPSLKSLSDTCTERIASNLPVWPKPSKKGLKIVPRLHFQLDIDHSDVEGRYLVPQGLLSFDKVQAQSRDRVSPGNGECPKIFQKAYETANLSNGRKIMVLLLQDTDNSPTLVYTTPCPAIDVIALGTAAKEFKNSFKHLCRPVDLFWRGEYESHGQVMPGWSPYETDVTMRMDRREGMVSKEDIPAKIRLNPPVEVPKLVGDLDISLVDRDIQYLISRATSAAAPLDPLGPTRDTYFPGHVKFQTVDRGCARLFPVTAQTTRTRTTTSPSDSDCVSEMNDWCSTNGALGCMFIYTVQSEDRNPHEFEVNGEIHSTWQFDRTAHRSDLVVLSNMLYDSLSSSFVITETVRSVLDDAGINPPDLRARATLVNEQKTSAQVYNTLSLKPTCPYLVSINCRNESLQPQHDLFIDEQIAELRQASQGLGTERWPDGSQRPQHWNPSASYPVTPARPINGLRTMTLGTPVNMDSPVVSGFRTRQ